MIKLLFALLIMPFSVFGQLHFVQNGKQVISKIDSLFDFETANYAKDNAKLSFQTDSTQYMEKIINHLIVHYQKGKNPLKQSLVLNQLAEYNLLKLKKVKIRKIKNIGSLNKKNRQIIRVSKMFFWINSDVYFYNRLDQTQQGIPS